MLLMVKIYFCGLAKSGNILANEVSIIQNKKNNFRNFLLKSLVQVI